MIGLVRHPNELIATPEEILAWADEAMRQSKLAQLCGNDEQAQKDYQDSTRLYRLAAEMRSA